MKSYLLPALIILAFLSCKPSAPADNRKSTNEQPLPSVIAEDSSSTSANDTTSSSPAEPAAEVKPLVPAKPKICDPNFTKLSSPKNYQHVVYVTNFNPEEFKCWIELENYGIQLSAGNSCIVYFVDKASIKTTNTPPHYLDDNTLKTAGIGRFEYNGKYWEIHGSNRWKRIGKGYGYYNTDNQLGG
ncbi:MAG: hypothetical protein SH808_14955 [Saprospiraceae bacterium]|nr:hypothetical protein [Saprospiraceae bacterium]